MKTIKAIVLFLVMVVALIATPNAYAGPRIDKLKEGVEVIQTGIEIVIDDKPWYEKLPGYEFVSGHLDYWPSILFGRSLGGMVTFYCLFVLFMLRTRMKKKRKHGFLYPLIVWGPLARIISGGCELIAWEDNTMWLLLPSGALAIVMIIWKRKWIADFWFSRWAGMIKFFSRNELPPWLQKKAKTTVVGDDGVAEQPIPGESPATSATDGSVKTEATTPGTSAANAPTGTATGQTRQQVVQQPPTPYHRSVAELRKFKLIPRF
ncbi:MAG: hypothetical protein IMF10_05650 [Proteobacteria bacterium]|nr:hypothetical protein [Pseudomonadota bacterium]